MNDRPPKFPADAASSDGVGGPPAFPSAGKPAKRKAIPARVQVAVAVRQTQHGCLVCPLCDQFLYDFESRILEHMVPRELNGSDEAENLRFVHKACADKKTNGTPATCASGDLHKIAKAKRLDKAREAHRAVLAGEATREPGKIKGRGFPKVHRPFRRVP